MKLTIPEERIEQRIFLIRGVKVMIDRDLAELYQVPTKVLNQSVKRNRERFPEGFMFRLTLKELKELVTICDRFRVLKHATTTPLVFTDYGVTMLSSILRSQRAIRINIQIVQTFIRLKRLSLTHSDLSQRIDALERKTRNHDAQIKCVFEAIRELAIPSERPRRPIGFRP